MRTAALARGEAIPDTRPKPEEKAADRARSERDTAKATPWRKASYRNTGDTDKQEGKVRLQRYMADCGVAARRQCEALIENGKVTVNGEIYDRMPVFVDPVKDHIVVDGRVLPKPKVARHGPGPTTVEERAASIRPGQSAGPRVMHIMLHKPSRVLVTTADDGGRATVVDLVQLPNSSQHVRLYPASPLDFHGTGLVLLTNDGELANRITHRRYNITRTWRLTFKGLLNQEQLVGLAKLLLPRGTNFAPNDLAPIDTLDWQARRAFDEAHAKSPKPFVVLSRTRGPKPNATMEQARERGQAKTVLEITLTAGPGGRFSDASFADIVTAATPDDVKLANVSLVGIGPLRLRGVALGGWRELERDELRALRVAVELEPGKAGGSSKPAHAHADHGPSHAPGSSYTTGASHTTRTSRTTGPTRLAAQASRRPAGSIVSPGPDRRAVRNKPLTRTTESGPGQMSLGTSSSTRALRLPRGPSPIVLAKAVPARMVLAKVVSPRPVAAPTRRIKPGMIPERARPAQILDLHPANEDGRADNPPNAPAGLPTGGYKKARVLRAD